VKEFVSEEIEVTRDGRGGPPASFVWRDKEYRVARIKRRWGQVDMRRQWWQRRHRDHYVVETESGELFEIYHHRGFGRRYWVLYRRVEV
jgi:hypothetical protein